MLHRIHGDGTTLPDTSYETDRRTFLGRAGTAARPEALAARPREALSGTLGHTLDPVVALQGRIRLAPGARCRIAFTTIAAGSRETALDLARRYGDEAALDWALDEARRETATLAGALSLDHDDVVLAQRLASRLLTGHDDLRPSRHPISGDLPGQPVLWSMGVSGDLPILVLARADDTADPILPRLVRIHRWWHRQGLTVDLVILREGAAGYEEPMRQQVSAAMREAGVIEGFGERGGIHLRASGQIGAPALAALRGMARVWIDGATGSLDGALRAAQYAREPVPPFVPVAGAPSVPIAGLEQRGDLAFDNGLGGFAPGSGDYVIQIDPGGHTPQPWSNVIANDRFGCVVTEAGGGFTWAFNSGENRLTPWSNDAVGDPPGEAIYLRDEETAAIWSVAPAPCGSGDACRVTHAPGATEWLKASHGLRQSLTVHVAPEAPVKLFVLSLSNPGPHVRRITATLYAEWVLGAVNDSARSHVVCDYDPTHRALLARSGWNPEFAARVAFVTASRPPHSLTCNRTAFLGPEGDRARPAGLVAWDLGGQVRDATDPCAAWQVHLDIAPGATERVVFALGQGDDLGHALALAAEWQDPGLADEARRETDAIWARRLGAITVTTPDPAFDLMVNRWLPYQSFASRILARSGFHQSGGAYGFRDQLQDMLAILHVEPDRMRAHLLECAAHQFEEGDVLHWWHPPSGRGVRTRCSDDMMWLPYATAQYVRVTGDRGILDERVPFLSAPELRPEEEDRYSVYQPGPDSAPLLDHCLRAMERGATSGAHGLPLMGGGDWNDGMDAVGRHGRGESVWLAWFAATAAEGFADLAEGAGRTVVAGLWRGRAKQLREAAEAEGWDGAWYKRAYDDDGLAWGSAENEECRIDSIAQSWSVLSGPNPAPQSREAMASLSRHLIDPEARLVRLLTAALRPQHRATPGYIRAYPPGVREKRRPIHPRRRLGGPWPSPRKATATARMPVFDNHQPGAAHRDRRGGRALPGRALCPARRRCWAPPPHTGRPDGPGTPAPRHGPGSSASRASLVLRIVDGKLDLRPCLPIAWARADATLTLPGTGHDARDDREPRGSVNGLTAARRRWRPPGPAAPSPSLRTATSVWFARAFGLRPILQSHHPQIAEP